MAMGTPDVCLSPPPAPTGPVPVPYPNNISAGDLASGSSTVKIQGQATYIKDSSNVSTSTGDEAGNQPGGVVTSKNKGKGYAQMGSFDVKLEGECAVRDGDPFAQNCASTPLNVLAPTASVSKDFKTAEKPTKPCSRKFKKSDRYGTPTAAQQKKAAEIGKCWSCGTTKKKPPGKPWIFDHQPPLSVYFYSGGCRQDADPDQETFAKDIPSPDSKVFVQCTRCSRKQGGMMSKLNKKFRTAMNRARRGG